MGDTLTDLDVKDLDEKTHVPDNLEVRNFGFATEPLDVGHAYLEEPEAQSAQGALREVERGLRLPDWVTPIAQTTYVHTFRC